MGISSAIETELWNNTTASNARVTDRLKAFDDVSFSLFRGLADSAPATGPTQELSIDLYAFPAFEDSAFDFFFGNHADLMCLATRFGDAKLTQGVERGLLLGLLL